MGHVVRPCLVYLRVLCLISWGWGAFRSRAIWKIILFVAFAAIIVFANVDARKHAMTAKTPRTQAEAAPAETR